jgi:hypothetical protein
MEGELFDGIATAVRPFGVILPAAGCVRHFAHGTRVPRTAQINSMGYQTGNLAQRMLNVRATFWEEG